MLLILFIFRIEGQSYTLFAKMQTRLCKKYNKIMYASQKRKKYAYNSDLLRILSFIDMLLVFTSDIALYNNVMNHVDGLELCSLCLQFLYLEMPFSVG